MKYWNEIKNDRTTKEYIKFLEKNSTVYYINNFPWIKYQGCLQPAIPGIYEPPHFNIKQIKKLIKTIKMPFISWSNNFTNKLTEWWWIICNQPTLLKTLSSNTRSKIRRGFKKCTVKKINADWLSKNGYECYRASFKRYKNIKPQDKNQWAKKEKIKTIIIALIFGVSFVKKS